MQAKPRALIPIDASVHLHFPAFGEGDDLRFSQVLETFWKRLPLAAKKVMSDFWDEENGRRWSATWGPLILLVEGWPGRKSNAPSTMKETPSGGFDLRFCSYFFGPMPNEVAVVWIAHEFAHVYQLATGTLHELSLTVDEVIRLFEREYGDTYENAKRDLDPKVLYQRLDDVAYRNSPEEADADRLVTEWGFDVDLLDRWLSEHGPEIEAKVPKIE